jgi:hypothetical protein
MPQASGSLSQEQRSTLTSVYTFALGSVLYLEAALSRASAEDALHLSNLARFGRLCLAHMETSFPGIMNVESLIGSVARVPAPGSFGGPCRLPCGHLHCNNLRHAAALVCPGCGKRIGFDCDFQAHELNAWHSAPCLKTFLGQSS